MVAKQEKTTLFEFIKLLAFGELYRLYEWIYAFKAFFRVYLFHPSCFLPAVALRIMSPFPFWRAKKAYQSLDMDLYQYGETPQSELYCMLKKRFQNSLEDKRFIDLGSGRGELCFFVQKAFKMRSIGVDIVQDFVVRANAVAYKLGIHTVCFNHMDITRHVPKGDIYYFNGLLMSTQSKKQMCQSIDKITSEGAVVISIAKPLLFLQSNPKWTVLNPEPISMIWGKSNAYLYQKDLV